MKKLHDRVFVRDRPEGPDLMKHHDEKTARFVFPFD